MHKCPPAESCRDAFERMSKATVQMSLSTTGFGSQVDLNRGQVNQSSSNGPYNSRSRQHVRHGVEQRQRPSQGPVRRPTQTRQSRPVPRFDMNLEDLFNNSNSSVPDHHLGGPRKPVHSYSRSEFLEASASNFTPGRQPPQQSPPLEFYGNYESPVSPQQQQQYFYTTSPQPSASPSSVVAHSGHQPPQAMDQEHPSGMSLDFLEFDSAGGEGQVPFGSDDLSEYSLQAMPSLGHGMGIDLGFGMAVDFQHDWSENPNYDILEGYFFGGSGAGPSGDAQ